MGEKMTANALWTSFCPQCGGPKSKKAKRCKDCWKSRKVVKRKVRKVSKEDTAKIWAIPTEVTLTDGVIILTRSKLEADWIIALDSCDLCYECLSLKVPQVNSRGKPFIGNYLPDLVLVSKKDNTVTILELKSNTDEARNDTRPGRALSLNREIRFLVIGGYPDRPFYIKMLTSQGEKEFEGVSLEQLLPLLGCE